MCGFSSLERVSWEYVTVRGGEGGYRREFAVKRLLLVIANI